MVKMEVSASGLALSSSIVRLVLMAVRVSDRVVLVAIKLELVYNPKYARVC